MRLKAGKLGDAMAKKKAGSLSGSMISRRGRRDDVGFVVNKSPEKPGLLIAKEASDPDEGTLQDSSEFRSNSPGGGLEQEHRTTQPSRNDESGVGEEKSSPRSLEGNTGGVVENREGQDEIDPASDTPEGSTESLSGDTGTLVVQRGKDFSRGADVVAL
ncbi:MAG: hypothetical protein R3245_10860, partial [Kiloniellales bacterium]|nr:hypothetical protein [Kiloniellales bacterium]